MNRREDTDSERPTPPRGDQRLRGMLLAALGILLATALIATVWPRSATKTRTAMTAARSVAPAATTRATTTPATLTGTAATRRAGGRCGFSIGSAAPPAPVGTCTVLEIGDSLGNDIGWGLTRLLPPGAGLNLVQADRSATGLANTDLYDWPARLPALLQQYHPQLVLVCLGGNDEQGMEVNGSAVQFPTQAWKDAYLARVNQVVHEATSSGAFVMWVGMPVMEQASYSGGMAVLDSLYQQGAGGDPAGAFASTWSLFSNPGGSYQSHAYVGGTWSDLRQADGIHLSFTGENVIATYVIRQIASLYHVQLSTADPAVITSWG